MSADDFKLWGWRLPFLVSVILLGVSVYIRLKLRESPVFTEMKNTGRTSKSPLTESFAEWGNAKLVLLALFGATAGQGVVWYGGQFYALYFVSATLKVDFQTTYWLIGTALLVGTPLFVFFGWLSDRIGRKPIIMAGCLLAAVTYIPIFQGLTHAINPALEAASASSPVSVAAGDCTFRVFSPPATTCDKAKDVLAKAGVSYANLPPVEGKDVVVKIGGAEIDGFDAKAMTDALKAAGYPSAADTTKINWPLALILLSVLMGYVSMVYGPIAAFLVELFPARIRYTSMSLPYHIGNGIFGGFLPLLAAAIVVATGDIYAGLYYPIGIAAMSFIIGTLLIRETKNERISR
jgi:MFS family permease